MKPSGASGKGGSSTKALRKLRAVVVLRTHIEAHTDTAVHRTHTQRSSLDLSYNLSHTVSSKTYDKVVRL